MIDRSIVVAMLVVAGSAGAQAPTTRPSNVCWLARPADSCRAWIITETSVELPVHSTYSVHPTGVGVNEYNQDFGGRVTFTGGAMMNRTATTGAGITATVSLDDPGQSGPTRIEARYRRWVSPTGGVDISIGAARKAIRGVDGIDSITARGVTASAGVTNTYFGIDGRLDLMRGDGRLVNGVFIGMRSGSRAGPMVAAAGFVLFLAAFAAMTGPGY